MACILYIHPVIMSLYLPSYGGRSVVFAILLLNKQGFASFLHFGAYWLGTLLACTLVKYAQTLLSFFHICLIKEFSGSNVKQLKKVYFRLLFLTNDIKHCTQIPFQKLHAMHRIILRFQPILKFSRAFSHISATVDEVWYKNVFLQTPHCAFNISVIWPFWALL